MNPMDVALKPVETGMSWRGFTRAYNNDRLGFLTALPAVGPVVRMSANLVFASDPALVETVFRGTNGDFQLTFNRRLESVPAGPGEAAFGGRSRARPPVDTASHRRRTG